MKKPLLLSTLLLAFSGCSNPYSQFYTDYTGGINVLDNPRLIITTHEPKLLQGSDIKEDTRQMLEDGYVLLGMSSFNAAAIQQRGAIEHAKKVHADTVMVYSQYTDTLSGTMPVTVPDSQTTYHSGGIYGPGGGFATYSGHSTTYGTRTTYIPYNIARYDYVATFWTKAKPPRLGVRFADLTPDLRTSIGSNKGVYIDVVLKNSPAFKADLLTGDIIRRFGDVEVIDARQFFDLLNTRADPNVQLEILREGETIFKEVTLASNAIGFDLVNVGSVSGANDNSVKDALVEVIGDINITKPSDADSVRAILTEVIGNGTITEEDAGSSQEQ